MGQIIKKEGDYFTFIDAHGELWEGWFVKDGHEVGIRVRHEAEESFGPTFIKFLDDSSNEEWIEKFVSRWNDERYEFEVGDRVNHSVYGPGTVISVNAWRGDSYVVQFDGDKEDTEFSIEEDMERL